MSRSEVTAKLRELVSNAGGLSLEALYKAGDYRKNPGLRYPQTTSERIVDEALNLLLDQDWVDGDPVFDEIASVLGQLDAGVDNPWAWQELFRLAREVK